MAQQAVAELFETRWGWMALCWRGSVLFRVVLPGSRRRLLSAVVGLGLRREEGASSALAQNCRRYFEGERVELSAPVEFPPVSEFRRRVWEDTARIPYGQVVTYGKVAARVGSPGGARAVGQALAQNPSPLVVPCHRVIAADGSLGGFSAEGGVELKRRLLALEGVLTSDGRMRGWKE